MNDLVSIITPSYNTDQFIAQTIISVINQTYINWEMIIVDDFSNDNTDEVILPFLIDERIKYFKNKKNEGAAISRNKAIKLAKGKWIAFLDSDDIWYPSKLEKQIEFMEKNNYNFTYTCYSKINYLGESLNTIVKGPKKIGKLLMKMYCWPGCLTVMYNRQLIGDLSVIDIKKNNDYAMWLKLIKKTSCYLVNEELGSYRVRDNSISRHRKIDLVIWHYRLFRNSEKYNRLQSTFWVLINICCGVYKKIRYSFYKGRGNKDE